MPAFQVLSQVVAGLVAVLGATGYVILLGAAVLWVRLHEAYFPREVPISFAGREELLVMGAQALAVWVVLALALTALASRMVASETLTARDVVADLTLGFAISVVTLTVVEGASTWITIVLSIVLAAVAAVWVVGWALALRPPAVSWIAAVVPVLVGVALPLVVHPLDETKTTPTVLTAWATFAAVLIWLPTMRTQRQLLSNNAAALGSLELEHPELKPGATTKPEASAARIAAHLREELREGRVRLWVRAVGVGVAGLLVLGFIAVASQFQRLNMFQTALVSLNTGRCVEGTYLSRNGEQVVLGDQRRLSIEGKGPSAKVKDNEKLSNKVVVIPASEVVELQVKNPVEVGKPLTFKPCKDEAVIAPDGTAPEPFRGPKGPQGVPGPTGAQGPTGKRGPAGDVGPTGLQGPTGRQGRAGARGPRGQRGPRDSDRRPSRGG